MKRKPYTLRLENDLYSAVSALSSVTHQSMNQLISVAVAEYVFKKGKPAEKTLEKTLKQLRSYTMKDPGFERAIADFAEAETLHDDPAEGALLIARTDAQREIRELISSG